MLKILHIDEIFGSRKPIIGVVHLKPLPGSPFYDGSPIESIIDKALYDAKMLYEGGVDGLIIENFWDSPFEKTARSPLTISSMSLVVYRILKEIPLPIGINLLRNSAIEAASIAKVTGVQFIRVNVYSETVVTDSGIIEPAAPSLLRFMSQHGIELGILADIHVKHGMPLVERDLVDVALDALDRGKASAVIVTGTRTGTAPSKEVLEKLSRKKVKPIIIGSGLNPSNIELLKFADGAIVGTYFKREGIIENPVDVERVKRLVGLADKYR